MQVIIRHFEGDSLDQARGLPVKKCERTKLVDECRGGGGTMR